MKSPRDKAIGKANHRLWLHDQKKRKAERELRKLEQPEEDKKFEGSVYTYSYNTRSRRF